MNSPEPHAIILAAGVGRRLGGAFGDTPRPKALLRFGGRSLLDRHLDALGRCGIRDVTIVVGFEAGQIRAAAPAGPAFIHNPDFREGSLVSLAAAGALLRNGRPLLLMDADVIYETRLLRRLVDSAHPNAFLLDREIEPGDEPVKLCIQGGRIVDFRKKPTAPHDWFGESVGFFRFTPGTAADLADRCDAYIARGERLTEYEEPIRDMVQADIGANPGAFGFEDISGMPWTEIDFPEDVEKAETLMTQLVA